MARRSIRLRLLAIAVLFALIVATSLIRHDPQSGIYAGSFVAPDGAVSVSMRLSGLNVSGISIGSPLPSPCGQIAKGAITFAPTKANAGGVFTTTGTVDRGGVSAKLTMHGAFNLHGKLEGAVEQVPAGVTDSRCRPIARFSATD
jgi:hypothetical protein